MRAVILVEAGFQDQELWYPYYRLQEADFEVRVATPSVPTRDIAHVLCPSTVAGKYSTPIKGTDCLDDLHGLMNAAVVIIPGGWECPERLRVREHVLEYLKFMIEHAVVGAICHGPWVLASADVLRGRRATCYSGMKTDLINAGATYVDESVVVDGRLVTAPHYRDNPAFMREIIKLAAGKA